MQAEQFSSSPQRAKVPQLDGAAHAPMPAPHDSGALPGVRVHCETCLDRRTSVRYPGGPCGGCFDPKTRAYRNWTLQPQ